jgi:hypothetical protein
MFSHRQASHNISHWDDKPFSPEKTQKTQKKDNAPPAGVFAPFASLWG